MKKLLARISLCLCVVSVVLISNTISGKAKPQYCVPPSPYTGVVDGELTDANGNRRPRLDNETIMKISFLRRFNFRDAVIDADLIADVTVMCWLGESNENNIEKTFYYVAVNNTFKGKSFDNIVLLQDGNSTRTNRDFPLFKNGDRLLLFLKEAWELEEVFGVTYENAYWMITSHLSVMDIQEYAGSYYVADRWGALTNFHDGLLTVPPVSWDLSKIIRGKIYESDPLINMELVREYTLYNHIYNYEDIENEINKILK